MIEIMLVIYNDITKCIEYYIPHEEWIMKFGCSFPGTIGHEVIDLFDDLCVYRWKYYPDSHHVY